MTEPAIQTEIIAFLSALARRYNFLYFSVPNESLTKVCKTLKISERATFALLAILKKMGLTPGVSDIIIGCRGKMYAVEVKTKTGVQSPRQELFESWCKACEVPYRVVRSVDDTRAALSSWGIMGGME